MSSTPEIPIHHVKRIPKYVRYQARLSEAPDNLPSALIQDGPSTPSQITSLTLDPECARAGTSAPNPTARAGEATADSFDSFFLFSGKKGFRFAKQPPEIYEEADKDEFDTDKPIEEES